MNVLFILAIVLASVGLISFILAFVLEDYNVFDGLIGLAIGSLVAAFVLTLAGGAKYDAEYRRESVRLCDQQSGVVTTDGQCFVDNRPVEFSPGVWRR